MSPKPSQAVFGLCPAPAAGSGQPCSEPWAPLPPRSARRASSATQGLPRAFRWSCRPGSLRATPHRLGSGDPSQQVEEGAGTRGKQRQSGEGQVTELSLGDSDPPVSGSLGPALAVGGEDSYVTGGLMWPLAGPATLPPPHPPAATGVLCPTHPGGS